MNYTKDQLQRQLEICQEYLHQAKEQKKNILDPHYKIALQYGEEVRDNHRRQINSKIEFYQKRIIFLMMSIEKLKM